MRRAGLMAPWPGPQVGTKEPHKEVAMKTSKAAPADEKVNYDMF